MRKRPPWLERNKNISLNPFRVFILCVYLYFKVGLRFICSAVFFFLV